MKTAVYFPIRTGFFKMLRNFCVVFQLALRKLRNSNVSLINIVRLVKNNVSIRKGKEN